MDSRRDAQKPVIAISWDDPQAYCPHYRKRLPTEVERRKPSEGRMGEPIHGQILLPTLAVPILIAVTLLRQRISTYQC